MERLSAFKPYARNEDTFTIKEHSFFPSFPDLGCLITLYLLTLTNEGCSGSKHA